MPRARPWEDEGWETVVFAADKGSVVMIRKTFRRPRLPEGKGPLARAAEHRPANFSELDEPTKWEIDRALGILDWDGDPRK